MDLEIIILSEVSLIEKDKYRRVSLISGVKKKWYQRTYSQNRERLTGLEIKLMVTKGEMWEEE